MEWLSEGAASACAGNVPAAIASLREAVRLDTSLAPAHYQLARALRSSGDAADAEAEAYLALNGMGATGGSAWRNSNDLFAGISKAVAEGRDYYTLGYVPSNTTMDGKFRRIAVEVKGRKVTLRAKRGYWATPD